jgi:predicted O-methyltransferase YrrM
VLALLVRMSRARRVLELGTLGGVSAIWMARALPPGGSLVTVEVEHEAAAVASDAVRAAGLGAEVAVVLDDAAATLRRLRREAVEPFDLAFLDADKASSALYLELVLPLLRPGAVVVADNVVRAGAVADVASADASAQGVRDLLALVEAEPRLEATALQTVGAKGHDGFLIAVVTG